MQQVAQFQALREALFDARGIDIPAFSRDIRASVNDAERLELAGQYAQALERLQSLQKYMPLLDIPSFDVHKLAGWLFAKLGQTPPSDLHRQRASSYRQLLWEQMGSGQTPDDPLRVVMNNEAIDWVKSRVGQVSEVRALPHKGRELLLVNYTSRLPQVPSTAAPSVTTTAAVFQLFVAVDPRTRQMLNRSLDRYAPIPLAQMRPQDVTWLRTAQEKRNRFLENTTLPYLELRDAIDTLIKATMVLEQVNQPQAALDKLRELERIRPIEDIPTPGLLSVYSALLGKTGNTAKQLEMRSLIFGVQQAIAHSGDAASMATAIEVLLIDEEYDWLREKKLKLTRQTLREDGGEKYDVMTVTDAQGQERTVFFKITRMYSMYSQAFGSAVPKSTSTTP